MARLHHLSKVQVQNFFKNRDLKGVVDALKLTEHDVQILREYLAIGEDGPAPLPFKLEWDLEGYIHFMDPPQLDLTKGHPCCHGPVSS